MKISLGNSVIKSHPPWRNLLGSSVCVAVFFLFGIHHLTENLFLRFTDTAAAVHHTIDGSSKDDIKERHNQTEDEPDVNHLCVRSGGQLLYLAGEDGGHHQHDGQVHSDGVTKKMFVKEYGHEADEKQEDGGEVVSNSVTIFLFNTMVMTTSPFLFTRVSSCNLNMTKSVSSGARL